MLSSMQRKNLEYFVGKVCSFLVPAINRQFSEKSNVEYFVGLVTKIDEIGIWYKNVNSEKMNFVLYSNLVTIAEETVSEKDDSIVDDSTIVS